MTDQMTCHKCRTVVEIASFPSGKYSDSYEVGSEIIIAKRLSEIRKRLLIFGRWAFLRYLHMREAFIAAGEIESVLIIGAGKGVAEVGLAIEFPRVSFHVTDINPYYRGVRDLCEVWNLQNISFGIDDICRPRNRRFDLVASVEVLEHIEQDGLAVDNMKRSASKWVFALVPFAEQALNDDPELRKKALERYEHHRLGYDADALQHMFPRIAIMKGCYWEDAGQLLRKRLIASTKDDIISHQLELEQCAAADIQDRIPQRQHEAAGIWVLAEQR